MKLLTSVRFLAVAAVVGAAVPAVASATTGTDSSGGSPVEINDTIHATNSGNTVLDGTVNITCKKSTVGGKVSNAGSSTTTISATIETLTFSECGNNTVTVVNKGSLEAHTFSSSANGNGTLTSSGAEVTVLTHNILGTVHCIYETSETDVGTLDGSNNTGGTATWTVDSVPLPRKSTDFGCGSTSEWTAEYTVSTPDYLAVDSTAATPPAATTLTTSVSGADTSAATLKAIVNPNGGETTYQFEYGTTTSYGAKVPVSAKAIGSGSANVEVSEAISGLSANTTYHYRISATNGAGTSKGEDRSFTTPGAPIVTTEAATAVSANEATLKATVNPKGAETTYQFEYGTTTAYGAKVPASAKAVGSGTSGVVVSQTPPGLAEGTTYHYRVVAQNEVGTAYGADKTATTLVLPVATTEVASSVSASEAILNGTVDPNGSDTTYIFEYGQTTGYGSTVPAAAEEGLTGTQAVEADEAIAHLEPSTTYHYRVVARSQAGVVTGTDKTLTTSVSTATPQQEAEEREEELHFTGKFAPSPSADFFGLQWTGDFREVAPHEMEAIRRSGTKVLRLAFWESASTPNPSCPSEHTGNGNYCWTTYDLILERAANRGIAILPQLGGGPLPTGAAMTSWEAFVNAAVNRYGVGGSFWPRITDPAKRQPPVAWEVWNEPNVALNGVGQATVDPVAFGNFLEATAGVIRNAAGPGNSHIILGGLLSVRPYEPTDPEHHQTVPEFLSAIDHHSAYNSIALHPYAFAAGETSSGQKYAPTGPGGVEKVVAKVRANIKMARDALDAPGMEGSGKKIWITEIGWPAQTFDSTHLKVEPAVVRELLEATFEMTRATRVLFNLQDVIYFSYRDIPIEDWAYRAGLKALDEHFRPAWYGFQSELGMPKWPNNPRVFTKPPEVKSSSANLIASVDPLGSQTEVWFKYGPTINYGTATSAVSAGFEEGEVDRAVPITGLTPNTEYHVVAVARNENGEKEEGTDIKFSTAPIKETTATVTEHLNGEPGWASIAGWSKYDGVGLNGFKVRINFLRNDGTYKYKDVDLVNGQYHLDNMALGVGTWETWSVFLAQGGYPESSSGYHMILIKRGYKLIAKHSQKCLDVNGGVIGNGAPMIQYKCGSPQSALNQIFTLVPVDDQHHYQLVARHSNRCVGVTAGSQEPGVQLSQYDCLGPASTHQIWKSESVLPNGEENSYNRFIAQNSGQCMEVRESSGADGGIVDQYGCAGTQANQLWTFESVEADQVPTQTFLTIDKNDTYHGMPGLISFHGRLDIAGRAYPLAGRIVHVIFERQNAQGGFEPVPGEEYNATLNSAGEFTYRYWGIGHDTWHVRAVFYGTGDALGKSESDTHTEVIKSGYRLMFRSSQKCLSTSNNGTANGTWLIQWTCNPNWNPWDGQTFSLYPVNPIGSNHWQLRPNTAYGQCVDVYGASTANGAPLNLYQCTPGAANQVWSFPELGSPNNGWFGGVALHSNKCMDVTAGNPANGVQIEQYECVWNGNQQFAWQVVP